MKECASLRSRWGSVDTQRINASLAGGIDPGSPFPMVEQGSFPRWDLRGIVITEMVRKVTMERIDFSCCEVKGAGQFIDASCVDCAFRNSALDTNLGTQFLRCDFSRAKLNVIRGRFEDCSFEGADLSGALGRDVQFIRCSFTDANLRKANLYACLFDHCRWGKNRFGSGSLAESRFIGGHPNGTELGNTVMDGVAFSQT